MLHRWRLGTRRWRGLGRNDDDRSRCRFGRGRRRDHSPGRQERHRVDVPVGGGRRPDAEMDVRRRPFRVARQTRNADHFSLRNRYSLADRNRGKVRHGDCIAHALDRHGPAGARHGSDERNDTRSGRPNGLTFTAGDIDPAVLPGRIRIGSERVGTENGPRQWPRPTPAGRDCDEGDKNDETDRETTHHSTSCGNLHLNLLPIQATMEQSIERICRCQI